MHTMSEIFHTPAGRILSTVICVNIEAQCTVEMFIEGFKSLLDLTVYFLAFLWILDALTNLIIAQHKQCLESRMQIRK